MHAYYETESCPYYDTSGTEGPLLSRLQLAVVDLHMRLCDLCGLSVCAQKLTKLFFELDVGDVKARACEPGNEKLFQISAGQRRALL